MTSLEVALARWRVGRDPALARLVDVLGQRAGAPDVQDEDWPSRLTSATDADVTPLLAALDRQTRADVAAEWLGALTARGPDPRVISAMTRWLVASPHARVRALALDALSAWAPEPVQWRDDVRVQHASALIPPPGPTDRAVEELLARVAQDVDSDAPREVLADYWIERGDPRGHFVRLQLDRARRESTEPNLGPELAREEAAILNHHATEWFGVARSSLICTRGFPYEVAGDLEPLLGAACLATARSLALPHVGEHDAGILAHPLLQNVRKLWDIRASAAAAVLECCPQAEQIAFAPEYVRRSAAAASAHPARRYVVPITDPADLRAFRVHDLVACVDLPLEQMVDHVAPEVLRLELQGGTGIALERTPRGWRVRLTPFLDLQEGLVPTSLAVIRRLLARGDVDLPSGPAPVGVVYHVRDEEDAALLRDLPSAPLLAAGWEDLPEGAEVWGPASTLWRDAPRIGKIGLLQPGAARPTLFLTRRPDGRADVRVTGRDLRYLGGLVGQIARVTGWGAAVEGWCAERGIPFEPIRAGAP